MHLELVIESLDLPDTDAHRETVMANVKVILEEAILVQTQPQKDHRYAVFTVREVQPTH